MTPSGLRDTKKLKKISTQKPTATSQWRSQGRGAGGAVGATTPANLCSNAFYGFFMPQNAFAAVAPRLTR